MQVTNVCLYHGCEDPIAVHLVPGYMCAAHSRQFFHQQKVTPMSPRPERSLEELLRPQPDVAAQIQALRNQIAALENAICPKVAARLTALERRADYNATAANDNTQITEENEAEVEYRLARLERSRGLMDARLARLERALGHVALELVKEI